MPAGVNLCHKPSADTRPRVGFSAPRWEQDTGNSKNRALERVGRSTKKHKEAQHTHVI